MQCIRWAVQKCNTNSVSNSKLPLLPWQASMRVRSSVTLTTNKYITQHASPNRRNDWDEGEKNLNIVASIASGRGNVKKHASASIYLYLSCACLFKIKMWEVLTPPLLTTSPFSQVSPLEHTGRQEPQLIMALWRKRDLWSLSLSPSLSPHFALVVNRKMYNGPMSRKSEVKKREERGDWEEERGER